MSGCDRGTERFGEDLRPLRRLACATEVTDSGSNLDEIRQEERLDGLRAHRGRARRGVRQPRRGLARVLCESASDAERPVIEDAHVIEIGPRVEAPALLEVTLRGRIAQRRGLDETGA